MNLKYTLILLLLSSSLVCPAADRAKAPSRPASGNAYGHIQGTVTGPTGKPVSSAWVMTHTGVLKQTGTDGTFRFTALPESRYTLKILAPGMEEMIHSEIDVATGKTVPVRIAMKLATNATALVSGRVTDKTTGKKLAAYFEIRDEAGPVRWFDAAGTPYGGRTDLRKKVWHQKNKRFWTTGDFAFSAKPGKLKLTARADGYATAKLSLDLLKGPAQPLEIKLEKLFDPADEGWFKGDFHAHGVHGERLYKVNIPFMAFIMRAEHYRWFYLSTSFNNDGLSTDPFSVAKSVAGEDLFLALNAEYPKTYGGHVGSVGIAPPKHPRPYPCYSNVETIKHDIVDKGGVAIPVHPLTGHMKHRELPLLIMGASELICGFDFYTSWNQRVENTWTMLLNKGYKLCRTATSDTAFDLGRTPGTMGATFIHPENGTLNRESIVAAFKQGHTTISWKGALILFTIDGKICGHTFPADKTKRQAVLKLYDQPGTKTLINVIRNGKPFKQFAETLPPSGTLELNFPLAEKEKAWYTATYSRKGASKIIAASSPFYFGDWERPEPVSAKITVQLIDAITRKPVNGTITVFDAEKVITSQESHQGKLTLETRIFHRLRATAKGYAPVEKGILDNPVIEAFIASVTEEDLQNWDTYEKVADLLRHLVVEIPMKRK